MTGQIFVYEVARQFRLSAPASVAPGAPFDVRVTALGMGNTTDALYRGTIRFSSSDPDPNIVLPADYTFSAADNGTHSFSGVVLRTQTTAATIVVTATAGGWTGQTTVRVGTRPSPPENIRIIP